MYEFNTIKGVQALKSWSTDTDTHTHTHTYTYGVCVCVYIFLSCDITSNTKMIVVTEAWVLIEIDLAKFLQISFLLLV